MFECCRYLSEQAEGAAGDGDGAHGGRQDGGVRGGGGGRRRRQDGGRGRRGQGRRVRGGGGQHGRGRRGGGGGGRGGGGQVRRGAQVLPVLLSVRGGPVQQRSRPISPAVQGLGSHGEQSLLHVVPQAPALREPAVHLRPGQPGLLGQLVCSTTEFSESDKLG